MKYLIFAYVSLMITPKLYADGVKPDAAVCAVFFENLEEKRVNENTDTHTQAGKPRYFSVKNYRRLLKSELGDLIRSFKNLTQFADRLEEVDSFIPEDRGYHSNEAFFIANEIIPLIEQFLFNHKFNFHIDTFEQNDGTYVAKRTVLVIDPPVREQVGDKAWTYDGVMSDLANPLKQIAAELANQKVSLVIDPLHLFNGHSHYNEDDGQLENLADLTSSYAISFYLLLHSQRADFKVGDYSHDQELRPLLTTVVTQPLQQQQQLPEQQDARARAEDIMNKIIHGSNGNRPTGNKKGGNKPPSLFGN